MNDMVPGFFWLIEDLLAGCARPGGGHAPGRSIRAAEARDQPDAVERDLAWLRRQGIGAVLSLTETPLPAEVVARQKLTMLHVPVPDLQAPTPDQFLRALAFIDRQRAQGRAVVVHCLMGQGRTGTVLAAYRIRGGASPQEALRTVRALCPGAIGSPAQEQALYAFAARRDWIL
jgi:atypical dual specificity phosphatase